MTIERDLEDREIGARQKRREKEHYIAGEETGRPRVTTLLGSRKGGT